MPHTPINNKTVHLSRDPVLRQTRTDTLSHALPQVLHLAPVRRTALVWRWPSAALLRGGAARHSYGVANAAGPSRKLDTDPTLKRFLPLRTTTPPFSVTARVLPTIFMSALLQRACVTA